MLSSPSLLNRKMVVISGWFRITLCASAACALAAAVFDDENFIDNFGTYFAISILTIATLRVLSFAGDWIAAGFSTAQLRRLVAQAKLICLVCGTAVLLYFAAPSFRYGVVNAKCSSREWRPISFVILDRVSGDVYRVERIPDRLESPRHPLLITLKL